MDSKSTSEKLAKQRELIGDFFIQFDRAISSIPFLIPQIVFPINITKEQNVNIETLLAGMNAHQLKVKFDSLIIDNFKDQAELIQLNKKLSNKTTKLIEIRNSFAHGSYRIGWSNFSGEISENTFSLKHSKETKTGYEKRSKIHTTKELEKLIYQEHQIYSCYMQIAAIFDTIAMDNDISIFIENLRLQIEKIGIIKFEHESILN